MSPKGDPREKKFTMLISEEEHLKLMELAHDEGLPAAMWIRRIVLERHRARELARHTEDSKALLGAKKPKATNKKK